MMIHYDANILIALNFHFIIFCLLGTRWSFGLKLMRMRKTFPFCYWNKFRFIFINALVCLLFWRSCRKENIFDFISNFVWLFNEFSFRMHHCHRKWPSLIKRSMITKAISWRTPSVMRTIHDHGALIQGSFSSQKIMESKSTPRHTCLHQFSCINV